MQQLAMAHLMEDLFSRIVGDLRSGVSHDGDFSSS